MYGGQLTVADIERLQKGFDLVLGGQMAQADAPGGQCVAAVAALRRELGTKSTLKVLIFEFITAWTVSFAVYRIALLI